MMRRLSLSVVGAFFTSNSTVAVALAMIISVFFFGYHCHYYPFRDPTCNRLHTLCLSILNLIYFSGLLLKTKTVEQSDKVDFRARAHQILTARRTLLLLYRRISGLSW